MQKVEGAEELDDDEITDIVTNYLACSTNEEQASTDKVNAIISKYCGSNESDKTYEFFFNLSQVYLKDNLTEKAIDGLRQAFNKSKQSNSYKDDEIRFKVQEMHLLNDLYNQYAQIDYKTKDKQTWFEFAKTIRNNILVELNINALSEVYQLNTTIFKEIIGSLHWRKLADRIKQQLKENQNLTQAQRNSMQINTIISLIKSNTFDEAKALLEKTRK